MDGMVVASLSRGDKDNTLGYGEATQQLGSPCELTLWIRTHLEPPLDCSEREAVSILMEPLSFLVSYYSSSAHILIDTLTVLPGRELFSAQGSHSAPAL